MIKHTPGPWTVDPHIASQVCQPAGSKRRRIRCPPDASGFADARLIAAAPDLLEALTRIAKVTDVGAETITPIYIKSLRNLARAVIAKAEGRNDDR